MIYPADTWKMCTGQQYINQENEKDFLTRQAAKMASLKKAGKEEEA